jgi:hypothetical protein
MYAEDWIEPSIRAEVRIEPSRVAGCSNRSADLP